MILIVEDDSDISRLMKHHLEAAGYEVKAYSSAFGVLPDAEKQPPEVFLLDIMIPGGDGMELCLKIRQNVALANIPIIFDTAKSSETDRLRCRDQGSDYYIT